jgi:hypothetical protein
MVVEKLKVSKPIITKFVEESKLKVVGANYELKSGIVRIIASFPRRTRSHEFVFALNPKANVLTSTKNSIR